jgi:Nucleotidyltransferase
MMKPEADIEPFGKFVEAIDPWLEQMVLVGGWAHRLYRNDPRARHLEYAPLTTLDGDVALPAKLKIEESTVRERLIDAGFLEEFVGEDRPPSTHYHYGPAGGFYVEFLTPLVGRTNGVGIATIANTTGKVSAKRHRRWVESLPSICATSTC